VIITNQTASVHVTFVGVTGKGAASGFQVAPIANMTAGVSVTIIVRMNAATGANSMGSFTMQVTNF